MLEPYQLTILKNELNNTIAKRRQLIQGFARDIIATSVQCPLQDFDSYVEDVFVIEYTNGILDVVDDEGIYFDIDSLGIFIVETTGDIRRRGVDYENNVRVRSLHIVAGVVEDLLEGFTNDNPNN
jgi:hypothetical protein